MQARIPNPAFLIPDAMPALLKLGGVAQKAGVPMKTLHLVYLRASQINGCSVCVGMHAREAREQGETEERLYAVGAWRENPAFSEAERAALALTEAGTRLADRADPVPDALWQEAARHYDQQQLAALTLNIAMINMWNRINAITGQVAGSERQ